MPSRNVKPIARRRFGVFAVIIISALAISTMELGCSSEPEFKAKKIVPVVVKRTPLEAPGHGGVLKGKVVYDGDLPPLEPIARINFHGDKEGCLKGGPTETSSQNWFVNKSNHGVRFVTVWLEPHADKYYALPEDAKKRDGQVVVVDQPHCAFVPHLVALYPSYFDGAQQVKTGQVLEIRNSAPFLHSVQWDPSRENLAVIHNLPPKDKKQFVLIPQKRCLAIGCGVHNWMRGVLWIFEHPYFAVTDEDGNFEMKNLPTGVELTFKAWHETRIDPFEVRKMTLSKGDNPRVDLTIKRAETSLSAKH